MATIALQDLLNPQSPQQIFAQLLAYYQAAGFPTTAWQPGGVERTRLMAISTAVSDVSAGYIPIIAGGGFLDYANTDWLTLLSHELYNLDRLGAEFTIGNVVLTANATSGPYNITQPGQVIISFPITGNRYKNLTTGTIPNNGSVTLQFISEFAAAKYADPNNLAPTLVTALPGVTANNPAAVFSAVSHVGSGVDTITPTGAPVGFYSVEVRIDATGPGGIAFWSASTNGSPFRSYNNAASALILDGNAVPTGITVTLPGVLANSYVQDDTYIFTAPGNWITQSGADVESNFNLVERDRDRWGSVNPVPVPTFSYYDLMVRTTPTVGAQVTQTLIINDIIENDRINIIVAGPAGVLPPATIAAIQAYIDPRVPLTDYPLVLSPGIETITLEGTVKIQSGSFLQAQADIEKAMINLIHDLGINGFIEVSKVIQLIMEVAGVTNVDNVTVKINGVNTDYQIGNPLLAVYNVGDLTIPPSTPWFTFVPV